MSTLGYFARNSLIRLFSFGVAIIVTFLITPHMLRCLGSAGYGVWALVSSLAGYYLLLDFGLFQAVSKYAAAAYAAADEEECARIRATAFALNGVSCLLALLVTGALVLLFNRFFDEASAVSFSSAVPGLLFASMALALLFRASQAILTAQLRWNLLAVLAMLHAVGNGVLVLWLLDPSLPVAQNLLRLAVITACGNVLEYGSHFCLTVWGGKGFPRLSVCSMATAKTLLRYSLPALVASLGDLLKRRTQIFIVATFLALSAVTLFSLVQQLLNYMSTIMLNAFGIMSPYFSRLQAAGEMENCRKSLLEAMRVSYAVSSYLGLCSVFYGGLFLIRWLGPQYGEAQSLLLPLGAAAIVNFGGGVVNGFLYGFGEHRILAALSLGEGIACILAGVPATWLYGLPGLVWTMAAIALIVQLGVLPAKVCRATGIRPLTYYGTVLGSIFVQTGTQGAYYLCVMSRLGPDYLILALACAGQFCIALLSLCASFYFMRRVNMEVVTDARS